MPPKVAIAFTSVDDHTPCIETLSVFADCDRNPGRVGRMIGPDA